MAAAINDLQKPFRDDALLDPAKDAARIRGMYTDPRFARQGVGRLVLNRCEEAAAAEGFRRLELIATVSGETLFRRAGFQPLESITDTSTGIAIPLVRMEKQIVSPADE